MLNDSQTKEKIFIKELARKQFSKVFTEENFLLIRIQHRKKIMK